MNKLKLLVPLAVAAVSISCSKDGDSKGPGPEKVISKSQQSQSGENLIHENLNVIACTDARWFLFESLQKNILDTKSVPSLTAIEGLVDKELGLNATQSNEAASEVSRLLKDFYKISLVQIPNEFKIAEPREVKKALGAIKVGDRSLPQAEKLQSQYKQIFQRLKMASARAGFSCGSQVSAKISDKSPLSEGQDQAINSKTPLAVWGLRKALATAYQSCESLRLEPMNRSTPSLQGVVDAGPYPGGGGRLRKIEDQSALANSHYYVKNFSPKPGCIDVKKQTMIYDYGGKPFTTSNPNGSLDYWKNNGDGSEGLGIDCSGYVFSSLASAGLRLVKGQQLKAFEVEDYPARMYIDANNNGFTCLESAKVGKNYDLQPGDIVATKYHIVMIESVGKDPLAIRKYDDCSKINYMDFDFVIAQSSPEQNAVGINKYDAKEYLAQKIFNPIQYGFVNFARAACQAYQANRDDAPSTGSFGISRHSMTRDCLQPEVRLVGSACIDSCKELFNQ